jgi:hypothetical protein
MHLSFTVAQLRYHHVAWRLRGDFELYTKPPQSSILKRELFSLVAAGFANGSAR